MEARPVPTAQEKSDPRLETRPGMFTSFVAKVQGALALAGAGLFTQIFGPDVLGGHALANEFPHTPVGAEENVALQKGTGHADGHCLLTGSEVRHQLDLSVFEHVVVLLLHRTDQYHFTI